MKIFLSWSGETSKKIAEYLKSWIEQIIQASEPWISVDIEKGKRWNAEISDRLEKSKVGIFCITKDNMNSPWILFEAGAISKSADSYVCTFLTNISPTDLTGPLSLFQATRFNKEDVYKLLTTINQQIVKSNERGLSLETLKSLFETFYPKLEEQLHLIMSQSELQTPLEEGEIRSERDLLEESVQILRQLKSMNIEKSMIGEARELLHFYAEKYVSAKKLNSVWDITSNSNFDDFMKVIKDNPFLLKVFGGYEKLSQHVAEEYNDLPF